MITYQIIVTGHVQGVGFRWSCVQLAQQLQLTGTVKNLVDGRVEIHVTGNGIIIHQFLKTIQAGINPYATVTNLTTKSEPLQEFPNFTIVY